MIGSYQEFIYYKQPAVSASTKYQHNGCVHLASSRCKQESEIYRLITEVTTTLSLFGTQHRTLVYEYCDFIPFSLASSLHSSTHFTKRGLGQPLGLLLRRVPASRSTRPAMLLQCNIVHHGLMQIVD